jgi:hypothetical protein
MSLNPFFLQGSSGEQSLIQDLINEQLRIYGIEVYYIPRKLLKTDRILNEVQSSKFNDSFIIEAYLNNYEGSSPGSDIMSKFGISLKNEITLTISKERFQEFISPFLAEIMSIARNYYPGENLELIDRPKEGDLIYFPLGERLFEIKRVEFEKPFYQLGKNYIYEILCELFEYEDEEISTGIDSIDDTIEEVGYITDLKLVSFGGSAKCEAIINTLLKGVSSITLLNDGYNYTEIPNIIISAPEGTEDTSSIIGAISTSDFSKTATAVAITTSINGVNSVKEILITNSGYGYIKPPTVTIIGGNGSGAIATAGISSGCIKSINIVDKGDRYYITPTITISGPTGSGTTSTAVARINSGRLSEILLVNAGSGYTSLPTITVSPPDTTIGFGTYVISEKVTGSLSGVTAKVKSWDNPGGDIDKLLRVYLNNGTFSEGENIVGSSSSAIYKLKSHISDTSITEGYSKNDDIQEESDKILDFTESNPFGTY